MLTRADIVRLKRERDLATKALSEVHGLVLPELNHGAPEEVQAFLRRVHEITCSTLNRLAG
jgi:hypothetical protein